MIFSLAILSTSKLILFSITNLTSDLNSSKLFSLSSTQIIRVSPESSFLMYQRELILEELKFKVLSLNPMDSLNK